MTGEGEKPAFVTCYQIIGLACFGKGQQKIVGGIGRAFHARQRTDILGELLDLVDQASSLMRLDTFGHARLLQRGAQLVDVRRAGQESKTCRPAKF